MFAAAIKTPQGRILYYTGKAGSESMSSNVNDGFFAYSEGGATRKAVQLCVWREAGLTCNGYKPLAVPINLVSESEGGHCD